MYSLTSIKKMNGIKFYVSSAMLILLATESCWAMTETEGRAMAANCKKEDVTDRDVYDFYLYEREKKFPASNPVKCFYACMMNQHGLIADGKFVPKGLVDEWKLATKNDDEMVQFAEEIGDECKSVADADRCELAVKIMQCIKEGAKKRGLPKPCKTGNL